MTNKSFKFYVLSAFFVFANSSFAADYVDPFINHDWSQYDKKPAKPPQSKDPFINYDWSQHKPKEPTQVKPAAGGYVDPFINHDWSQHDPKPVSTDSKYLPVENSVVEKAIAKAKVQTADLVKTTDADLARVKAEQFLDANNLRPQYNELQNMNAQLDELIKTANKIENYDAKVPYNKQIQDLSIKIAQHMQKFPKLRSPILARGLPAIALGGVAIVLAAGSKDTQAAALTNAKGHASQINLGSKSSQPLKPKAWASEPARVSEGSK